MRKFEFDDKIDTTKISRPTVIGLLDYWDLDWRTTGLQRLTNVVRLIVRLQTAGLLTVCVFQMPVIYVIVLYIRDGNQKKAKKNHKQTPSIISPVRYAPYFSKNTLFLEPILSMSSLLKELVCIGTNTGYYANRKDLA